MAKKHETYKDSLIKSGCIYLQGWFKKQDEKEVREMMVNKTKLKEEKK